MHAVVCHSVFHNTPFCPHSFTCRCSFQWVSGLLSASVPLVFCYTLNTGSSLRLLLDILCHGDLLSHIHTALASPSNTAARARASSHALRSYSPMQSGPTLPSLPEEVQGPLSQKRGTRPVLPSFYSHDPGASSLACQEGRGEGH